MRKTTLKISKILSVALLFMLSTFSALAQNVISGKVTDSKNGNAVSNVTVTVKGTRVSAQTGADGSFRINAPATASTLVFSSVGYAAQEVSIKGKTTVNISFVQSEQKLDDIIVVAYWLPLMGPSLGSILRLAKNKHTKIICIAHNAIPHEKRFAGHW